ncbi:Chondroadherin-like protein like [Argiope bruennichi]|uniref:Chondroadherin-like protein like n=1 Tax=Argiope bruennichi TaxID=94029 RepID=A0A8T0EDA7_ARGBR|nr:Chondroadherin-like protein like [Argiope bruennichi]
MLLMATSRNFMKTLLILLLCFSWIKAQCPSDPKTIEPCQCTSSLPGQEELVCNGPIGLVRLTTVLRNEMCGRTIGKFKLTLSDIEYLPSNLFFKIIVRDIQISFTYISHFTKAGRSAFFGLEPYLQSLSMRRGKLVDDLDWQKIGDLHALTYLDLSFNNITRIPLDWFDHPPPNLLSLILKGNKIKTLESGSLSHMHELIELDLSDNQIHSVTRDFFSWPGNAMIFLRLNDNQIKTLPMDIFDEMMGLRRIYLDNNQLESIPEELWSPIWTDLEILDLRGNPLNCNSTSVDWIAALRPPLHLYGSCQMHLVH